jgi:DNA topoisomerase-3
VLSIGRVQTPTLALIVNRQLEIAHFVPKQYWELKTTYRNTLFSAIVRKSDEELAEEEANAAANKKAKSTDNRGIPPILKKEDGEALLALISDQPFTITEVGKKNGTEAPPRLFDLTSLQVECNKKFAYSADDTLRLIQSLYEKKFTTYPRVDTTFLSDDIYPKCPNILKGLRDYSVLTAPLEGKSLPKSKKVFDNSKVTDHHAIIPTGVYPQGLTDMERRVYDLVARRFISVFYPDCKFATTTVIGETNHIEFKATGRQILDPGWKVIYQRDTEDNAEEKSSDEERMLPAFTKGESGPHRPELNERWTQPPKPYTEATLLRAMETAGKLVDNDELRDALKENGIGRPSTRAAIIETLFKRRYIRKERKNLIATDTGIELIQLIHEDLLKSAELTGIWEKKLREIERKSYDARTFLEELKQMVCELVHQVLSDNTNRRITVTEEAPVKGKAGKKSAEGASEGTAAKATKRTKSAKASSEENGEAPQKRTRKPRTPKEPEQKPLQASDVIEGRACPICGKGIIIKGRTAFGCSEWKNGCTFRFPFATENNA